MDGVLEPSATIDFGRFTVARHRRELLPTAAPSISTDGPSTRWWHSSMRAGQHRTSQARKVLLPVYRRFTEGFKTADLMAAKALLDTLR